jgi:hypothetical protein
MNTTIAQRMYEQESSRINYIIDEFPVSGQARLLRSYNWNLRNLFVYRNTTRLTNYQLWKLRQEVIRHLITHNINTNKLGGIQMETSIPCQSCDTPVEPDDAVVLNDEAYCEECTCQCESCEDMTTRDDAREDGYLTLCEDCYDNNYITCEECDRFVHTDDYVSVQDTYLCTRCYENGEYHYCSAQDESAHGYESDCSHCNRGSDEYLHNYSYKPDPLFHDTRMGAYRAPLPNKRYFGVELETTPRSGEYRDDAAEWIAQNISEEVLYMKEDSSISSGFEIVTHPMTLDWARNNFPWNMLQEISDRNMRAWNDYHCGLHIHINRTSFRSQSHLAKLLLLVYRNSDEMIKFTGRHSSDYADYSSDERDNFVARAKGNRFGRRGVAVNCQNEHTIELRVFRPSLKRDTVQAYIEFCDALVVYAGTITVEDCVKRAALSFGAFTSWLTTQTDENYSVLATRIQSRVYANA